MADSRELTPIHKEELRRTERLLQAAGGFRLVIAEFNDPQFRRIIIDEINGFGVKSVVLEVSRTEFPNFYDFELKIAELSKTYNVIHVIDLDTWLKMDEGDRMVLGFNYHRESIADGCKASLFLWMTELGIYSFMTTVPDMWSWRSAVLTFMIEKEKTPTSLLADEGYDYLRAMPRDRRLARIDELEKFLASPPSDLEGRLLSQLYKELGSLSRHLGTSEGLVKGMDYFERALKIDVDMYGEEHQSVAEDYNNIGLAWINIGESKKAIEYYEKALKIALKVYGANHPNIASTYNNVGSVWDGMGNSKKAIECLEKALEIYLKVYGENHPEVATGYSNIGNAWNRIGELKKALEYHEKALEINLKVYGENHPNVAVNYNNIGSAWYKMGESKKALEYYEKALEINLKVYGENHPNVATVYGNIGYAWSNLGESKKALEYYEKALSISRGVFGDDHPQVKTIQDNINLIQKPNPQ
ncbi:tetratricopeptide repeat protein [Candidatus Magnetominusculus dajiuhuensis]|uniref:tetratricopeptide repeat protein n=1 Tax=Candidatus Magnetominusculus dajiuhuensis TaxID=3137712 RepID=UPI003B432B63